MKMNLNRLACVFLFVGCVCVSCSKDDGGGSGIPDLKKLIGVTCTKNNALFFTSDITYTSTDDLSRIVYDQQESTAGESLRYNYSYLYNGNVIAVSRAKNGGDAASFCKYTTSSGGIVKEEFPALNNNTEYTAKEYVYNYVDNYIKTISWKEIVPKEDGFGYQETLYANAFVYNWSAFPENNLTSYTEYTATSSFVYGKLLHPLNFTFRPDKDMQFIGWDCFSPINLLYGRSSKNLPESASTAFKGNKIADYTFTYESTGDYITSMYITVKLYAEAGDSELKTEQFQYRFTYE